MERDIKASAEESVEKKLEDVYTYLKELKQAADDAGVDVESKANDAETALDEVAAALSLGKAGAAASDAAKDAAAAENAIDAISTDAAEEETAEMADEAAEAAAAAKEKPRRGRGRGRKARHGKDEDDKKNQKTAEEADVAPEDALDDVDAKADEDVEVVKSEPRHEATDKPKRKTRRRDKGKKAEAADEEALKRDAEDAPAAIDDDMTDEIDIKDTLGADADATVKMDTIAESADDVDLDATIDKGNRRRKTAAGAAAGGAATASETPVFEPEFAPAQGAEDAGTINAYTAIQEHRQKKRRGRVGKGLAAAAVVAALVGGGAWYANSQGSAQQEEQSTATDVVTFGEYQTSITASGATRPNSSSEVTPEVDGIITEVNIVEGDYVQKGDVLFLLKNDALDSAVTEAQEGVTEAEKGVAKAQDAKNKADAAAADALANLNRAESQFSSIMNTSYETQEEADAAGVAAEDALVQAQEAYSAAQDAATSASSEVDTATKALTKAQDERKEAQDQADKRIVTAPRDGTVITCSARTGAAVGGATGGNGDRATGSLVTIGDLSQMRVTVQVNEVDISNIATGQKALVNFSALDDLQVPATVEHISAVSSGSEGDNIADAGGIVTYDVDLVIPEPDERVKPGMTARVEIITESIPDTMMVPVSALAGNADGTFSIFVVNEDDNTSIERTVEVKAQNSSMAAIEGNIAEGEIVQLVSESMLGSDEDEEGTM